MVAVDDYLPPVATSVIGYLLPAVIGAIALRAISSRSAIFAIAVFLGVFVHEVMHLIVGTVSGASPVSMSLIPRKAADGRMIMGSVSFENLRWFNAAPTCLAPLLALPLVVWIAWLRVAGGWHFQLVDLAIWGGLTPQFIGCWPSSTDLRLSLISWPIYVAAVVCLWAAWFPHP